MPRFHFNVHDGHSTPDPDGSDLPNLTTARAEAVKLAGTLISEEGAAFWNGEGWRMDVTDDDGLLLFKLHFIATVHPAQARRRFVD